MKLLLHTCCANCLADSLEGWRRKADEVAAYWFNPNIHPFVEYRRRLKSVKLLTERLGLDLVADEDYGLIDFLRSVTGHEDRRCEHCHRARLQATAAVAARQGFEAFATTLSVSPQQNHDIMKAAGIEAAAEHGVEFLYEDMRGLHGTAASLPKGLTLYRQQYCGCIYSEADRYRDRVEGLPARCESKGGTA